MDAPTKRDFCDTKGKMNRAVCALVLVVAGVPVAFADGLIWQLPPDGTAVEFEGDCRSEFKPVLSREFADKLPSKEVEKLECPQNVKLRTSVTVSSVGQVTRVEQKCRWIELTWRSNDNENVLKVLVPEKFLTRGEDPLDHAILTFFNPKPADKAGVSEEKGFNRIQYELDRFRSVFPTPLKEVRQLANRTIETPLGMFADCEVIAGTTEFDRPLRGGGHWASKSSWQLALHPDAPFGIVQIQCSSTGSEFSSRSRCDISSTLTLTISGKGHDAKSSLPGRSVGDGDGKSETPSVENKSALPSLKEAKVEIGNQVTALPRNALTSVLLQEAVQKELNLSRDQIARVRKIDEGLNHPTDPEEAQYARRVESVRQQLEKDLSQEQIEGLVRIALRSSDPISRGLNNPWMADWLKLTPEQKKTVAEILRNTLAELIRVKRETERAIRSNQREEWERLNQQHRKIVEEARQQVLGLLTAGQREEFEKLNGESSRRK